jgi:hypothetical protein
VQHRPQRIVRLLAIVELQPFFDAFQPDKVSWTV